MTVGVVLFAEHAGAQPDIRTSSAEASREGEAQRAAKNPSFFGTVAVPISADRFRREWQRARRDASALPEMRQFIAPAVSMSRRDQIAYVQAAVSRRIGWRSDATQYGRHDYWASAEETFRNGRGDMEDRAIVKMQALRALGIPSSDLYLTLGRDIVGGPQAMLIVRTANRYDVLDDSGGPPFTPEWRPEFQPVLTFGYGNSWVHIARNSKDLAVSADTSGRESASVDAE